jgi:uncharacterized protein YukE
MKSSKVKLSFKEIGQYLHIDFAEFPKYVAPLINLANQFAQGTRPRVVGQLSELINEFGGKTFSEWEKWYQEREPGAIDEATNRIYQMLQQFKDALNNINKDTVEKWVRDLVLVKTFIGLKFQEAILRKGAELKEVDWRFASPEEESKGIDGFIGDIPVSIKPSTYKAKGSLPESISCKVIYYEKVKDGIVVDYSEILGI